MMQRIVERFEKRMGWNKTKSQKIIKFIKKDAKELTTKNARHKMIDILFECIQLANRKGMNVTRELGRHMKDAQKKYTVRK
ncbi:MAG: hypothetical protein V1678_03620 [Candidatus Aenigmatarchaeota archaeon]